MYRENGVNFADLGVISDILIGALAAVITFTVNQPIRVLQLVAATLLAGIGGNAILKSYIKGKEATKKIDLAKQSQQIAKVPLEHLITTRKALIRG